MSEMALALPVSVEQVAIVVKQMSQTDQKRLLELVPSLRQLASSTSVRTVEQTQTHIEHLQADVLTALDHQLLSPDEPFLGDLTLGQYHDLPDEKKAALWDEWANVDMMELEEQEVSQHALPPG